MGRAPLDLRGKRFGKLVAVERAGAQVASGAALWRCACDCGSESVRTASQLSRGSAKSCGCWNSRCLKRAEFHGMTGTRAYKTWAGIVRRCTNPNEAAWHRYGGRGITICDRWRFSFAAFLDDMGAPPAGLTIERRDNDKGYEPGNCVWATRSEQAYNRACRMVEFRGERLSISELARRHGLADSVVRSRLDKLGWPIERAVGEPVRPRSV